MKTQPSNWNTRDSSGSKGLNETPQSVARGGSLAARGKRVYSSCGSRREYFDATSFPNTQLLLEIWKELLKRSTSVDKATNVSDGTSKRSPRTRTLISYGKALTSY